MFRYLLAIFFLVLASASVDAQTTTEFPELRFGMSRPTVEKLYPKMAEYEYSASPGGESLKLFGMASTKFAGCDTRVSLSFGDKNELQNIHFMKVGGDDLEACRGRYRDELSQRFGKPASSASMEESLKGLMKLPSTEIVKPLGQTGTTTSWSKDGTRITFTDRPNGLDVLFESEAEAARKEQMLEQLIQGAGKHSPDRKD